MGIYITIEINYKFWEKLEKWLTACLGQLEVIQGRDAWGAHMICRTGSCLVQVNYIEKYNGGIYKGHLGKVTG